MDNKKRTILSLYITEVSGHKQATVAIQYALRQLAPTIELPAINGFEYAFPVLEKVVNAIYMFVIKRMPWIWEYLYDNPTVVKRSQFIEEFLYNASHKRINKLLSEYQPEAVICTQAFPCGMVAHYKTTYKFKTKLYAVLTDYSPHTFWINEGIDYYIVPSTEVMDELIVKGVNPNQIKVFGIPLHPKFSQKLDRYAIAQKLNLNPNAPTILIMGGGRGLGPIKKIIESLLEIQMDLQMVVLAGTNSKILKQLKKHANSSDKKMLIFDHVDNVEEYMELATLIISKPGGITTAESLVKGLPMVIVDPIPGQEIRNKNFLEEQGAAVQIENFAQVGPTVEQLLKFPAKLASMRQAALSQAKPNAASDITKLVLGYASSESQRRLLSAQNLENYV